MSEKKPENPTDISLPPHEKPRVQLVKLYLQGFKSFVDTTELPIGPGVSAIVGPNGCGKSNLIEALRWVMGENSAHRLRGQEMDDVIFNGSDRRAPRSHAEVRLHLDNSASAVAPPFHQAPELVLTRKISRGTGSSYSINNQAVRARDIQLLLQDQGAGAGASSLIGQGQIARLMTMSALQRRVVLDEAAGVSGLFTRRRETDNRLKATEQNLQRLGDILAEKQQDLSVLKRQAAQARQYQRLTRRIHRLTAYEFLEQWQSLGRVLAQTQKELADYKESLEESERKKLHFATQDKQQEDRLEIARRAVMSAQATYQKYRVSVEKWEEAQRLAQDHAQQLLQFQQDLVANLEREQALLETARKELAALGQERLRLERAEENLLVEKRAYQNKMTACESSLEQADQNLQLCLRQLTQAQTQRQNLQKNIASSEDRQRQTQQALDQLYAELTTISQSAVQSLCENAQQQLEAAQENLAHMQKSYEAQQSQQQKLNEDGDKLRRELEELGSELAGLRASERLLQQTQQKTRTRHAQAILHQITISPGYESAVAAALGEAGWASVIESNQENDTEQGWYLLAPADHAQLPHWPDTVNALADYVQAPAILSRFLSLVGVVAEEEVARKLQAKLSPGQMLVSLSGALWRWDGYWQAVPMQELQLHFDAVAELRKITPEIAEKAEILDDLQQKSADLSQKKSDANREITALAIQIKSAQKTKEAALQNYNTAQLQSQKTEQRQQYAEREIAALQERLHQQQQESALQKVELQQLADEKHLAEQYRQQQELILKRRQELTNVRREYDQYLTRAQARSRRLKIIAQEERQNHNRILASEKQIAAWQEKLAAYKVQSQEKTLIQTTEDRQNLQDQLEEAQQKLQLAEEQLVAEQKGHEEVKTTLAQHNHLYQNLRESYIRIDSQLANLQQEQQKLYQQIGEKFGATPRGLRHLVQSLALDQETGDRAEDDLPNLFDLNRDEDISQYKNLLQQKRTDLLQRRDRIGPVNLQAARDLEEKLAVMEKAEAEKADVAAACEQLQKARDELDREASHRLRAAFGQINDHFQTLFVRLFGGGRAFLRLTNPDHPLETGLEIFASPPGKKCQHLSLLSGGEQALAALALIFAMFLSRPAPLCVLDEADAPLDDVNVKRFCDLVAELAETYHIRFLVITHHRMTMARAQHLFGVTMSEKGISQLVGVDLERASALAAQPGKKTSKPVMADP